MLEHEEVRVVRGPRSGLPVIVAVHSTVLGQAVGGLRMWHYPDWRDARSDALRLARGMTYKAAAAGAAKGGGKTVVAVPPDVSAAVRHDALLDAGDVIESFGGRYATGPDVGTSEADMDVIASRTRYVFCRPLSSGGSGDSSPATARGVLAALRALGPVAGRRFAVVGLGRVGGAVASGLAASGGTLVVGDVDPSKRALAASLGATWVSPAEALTADVDVVVPAALGGVLTADVVPRLRCTAIAGPANNQLADDSVADLLQARGIVWAPDHVVSMGGVINALAVEVERLDAARAAAMVDGIGDTVRELLDIASREGITPARAAMDRARARLGAGIRGLPAGGAERSPRSSSPPNQKVHSGRD